MRLLNAKTMELHSFFQESTTPGYAILSHTWHEGEVLFEDLQDISRALLKPGFTKIEACCKQALREGLQFVWIDTCCIDKSSSAELSEAINSMYRWYKLARVCFAYLRDVVHPGDNELEIGHSRWFQRAWTLQELLAPRYMSFYSTGWRFFGTRETLKRVISEVTGIGEEYLSHDWNRDIYRASVAKRMSWAANREATRAEDIAYSLFGIFNVNMPLLYGEGQEKAFRNCKRRS